MASMAAATMSISARARGPRPLGRQPSFILSRSSPRLARSIAPSPRSRRRTAGATTSISISGTTRPPAPHSPRPTKGVEREADGEWIIAPDHLARAATYERRQAKEAPVVVRTLSVIPIERQLGADGATWLDRELVADAPVPLRDSGFGRE